MSLKDELRNATIGNTIVDGTVTWVVDAPIYTYQGADNSNKVFKVNTSGLAVPAYLTASDITSGVFSIDLIPDISKTKITDFAHTHPKSEISDFAHTHHADEIVYYVPEPPIDPETGEYEIDPDTGETVTVEPPVFDLRLLPRIPFNKLINVMDDELSDESGKPVRNRVLKAALDLKADSATTLAGYGITDAYTKTEVGGIAEGLQGNIDAITDKIPAQATASNQLADKAFVNSSIGTNTANYISNDGQPFTSVAQLEAYTGTVTNNDYAFVTGTDTEGNTYFDRYKATVSGSSKSWAKEFRLNNSSFTAAQWDAISSGITATKVSTYDGYAATISGKAAKATTLAGYGITDAKIDNGVITLGANTITPITAHQSLSGYSTLANTVKALSISGKTITYTKGDDTTGTLTTQDTTYNVMGGATSSAAGTSGLVPAPAAGKQTSFLRGDGTWETPTNTTYSTATTTTNGLMSSADKSKLDGIATGATANTGTITGIMMNGASKGTSGVVDLGTVLTSHQSLANYSTLANTIKGLSISGKTITYTKGDGSTGTLTTQDTNTTYSNMGAATANAAGTAGLVPAPAAGKQTSFLRGDGTWVVPTNTTYSAATTSAAGLMSAADKSKLDGIATGATANTGTITGITMNGASKGTSGVVDLGTVLTSHQDISGKADKASITAGTAGTSSATSGSTLAVPYVTVNAQGVVTGYGTHTHTISGFLTAHQSLTNYSTLANTIKALSISGTTITYTKGDGSTGTLTTQDTNTTYSVATTSANGLMSASDKSKLDGIPNGGGSITMTYNT